MNGLLLHPQTKNQLAALLVDPPHALLLVGPSGIGKFTIARQWGSELAPHSEVVSPDQKGTIPIESIRELYRRTRSRHTDRQVVIVDHAEAMGIEAQNAFLKLLEEPRAGVTFVLTAATPEQLLPTITSRVQTVAVQPLSEKVLHDWLKTQTSLDQTSMAQLLFMAQGRPATAVALLQDEATFTHGRELMQLAKKLVSGTTYDRLATIPALVKDKADLTAVLEAMAHMLSLHIRANPDPRLIRMADGLQTCLARLAQNGNARAQLTNLFMLY